MARKPKIERFNQRVLSKYQIYNNLFLTLPFSSLKKTSILLPLFTDFCKSQYKNNNDPKSIVDSFFSNYLPKINSCEKNDILFNFIKYIERFNHYYNMVNSIKSNPPRGQFNGGNHIKKPSHSF